MRNSLLGLALFFACCARFSLAAPCDAALPAGFEPYPTNTSLCSPVVPMPLMVQQRGFPSASLQQHTCAEIGSIDNQWVCTLPATAASYGTGDYHLKVSSTFGTWSRDVRFVFDGQSGANSFMGSWADRTYSEKKFTHPGSAHHRLTGISDYAGEWLVLMLPVHVAEMSHIRIADGTAADYRLYARSSASNEGWRMILDVVGATYSNASGATKVHVSPAVQSAGPFDMFGLVVKRCTTDSLSMRELSFIEGASTAGQCNAGTFELNATHCMLCLPGTFSNASSCDACPAGTYAHSHGSWMCTPCPAGTYSAEVGASGDATCAECPAGTYSPAEGHAACLPCEVPGFVNLAASKDKQGKGSTKCVLVPAL